MITNREITKNIISKSPTVISITKNNLDKYGFSRFCYPGETKKEDDSLVREIEVPSELADSGRVKFVFKESYLILLSKNKRNSVTTWNNFSIESSGKNSDHMFLLSQRAGWNQTYEDVKEFALQNPEANLLAIVDTDGVKNSLGTGLVLKVGDNLSWIGMILVHPELRRQGIANSIMERCIAIARLNIKTPIVGLDATPAGLNVYKRMGFKESFKIWRCTLQTNSSITIPSNLIIENSPPIETIVTYLSEVNQKEKLLELKLIQKLYPSGVFLAKNEHGISGFVMTRPGRRKPFIGPLVASSLENVKALLAHSLKYWSDKGFKDVFIDVPEKHFEIESVWNNEGECLSIPKNSKISSSIFPLRSFVRMYEAPDDDEAQLMYSKADGDYHKAKLVELAVANQKKTHEFMDFERNEMLKWVYAIGGPELS